jgi:hypothetical protein
MLAIFGGHAGRRRVLRLPSLEWAAARSMSFKRGVVGGAEARAEAGAEARAEASAEEGAEARAE